MKRSEHNGIASNNSQCYATPLTYGSNNIRKIVTPKPVSVCAPVLNMCNPHNVNTVKVAKPCKKLSCNGYKQMCFTDCHKTNQ